MYFARRELEASGIERNCRAKVLGNVVGYQEGMHKRSQHYYIDTACGNCRAQPRMVQSGAISRRFYGSWNDDSHQERARNNERLACTF
jgi:hypothetical protein